MGRIGWLGVALLSLGFLNSCGDNVDNINDRFWMISRIIPDAQKTDVRPPNLFWRTHTVGSTVEGYELCNSANKVFTATGNAQTGWVLTTSAGNLNASIDENGKLVLTTLDGKPWGTGQRIMNGICEENKSNPISVITIDPPPGEQTLAAAGPDAAHIEETRGETLQVNIAVQPTPGKPDTTTRIGAETILCKTQPLTESAIRDLTDSPALSLNQQLWPGNLIQGSDLAKGKFTPITIARAPGIITITGVQFADPSAVVFKDLSEPRYGGRTWKPGVTQAIADLLSQPIQSTDSVVSFDTRQVYSNEQLAFALGVDGRYAAVSFTANLNIDQNSSKNYVLARFTQIFYTITFEDPESAYSVFRDGNQLQDPENQIGKGNPPLYIKSIGYGRQIYFLASSTQSGLAVKAALEGAYGSKDAGNYISVNTSSDYSSAMKSTEVSYFAFGGGSGVVTPIKASTPEKMYDAVRATIADLKSAQVGSSTQGLPLTYTVNYLTSRKVASLGYATAYDRTNCQIERDGIHEFLLDLRCVDDSAEVDLYEYSPGTGIGIGRATDHVYSTGLLSQSTTLGPLSFFLGDKDKAFVLRLKEYNIAGPWCNSFQLGWKVAKGFPNEGKTFYLNRSNNWVEDPTTIIDIRGWGEVGNNSDYNIILNPVKGPGPVLRQ